LFTATDFSTTVVIAGNASHPIQTGSGQVLAPTTIAAPTGEFWAPERAPAGPITIVMSRSDQAVSVLRNGIEIGRSAAVNTSSDEATHVLTLGTGADGKPVWIYAGVAGHADEDGRTVDEATRNRVQLPQAFHDKLAALLAPGATLLVTQSPLSEGATGTPLTVLSGAE